MRLNALFSLGLALALLVVCSNCLIALGQDQASQEAKARVEKATDLLAEKFSSNYVANTTWIFSLLRDQVKDNPDIYGACFAFAPSYENGTVVLSAPYAYREGETIKQRYLADNYHYPEAQWYAESIRLHSPVWSDLYYDNGGAGADILMTTYSVPIFTRDEVPRLLGVITGDLLMSRKA